MTNIIIEPFEGVSKSGKNFSCFKLIIGDFETLIFPRGKMERKYIERIIGDGLTFEAEND